MVISAFGVFVNNLLRRSKRHRSFALQYMLRNVVPGDGHGAWPRLAVHPRVTVSRTIMGCADYVAGSKSNSKEAHLTCSKLIQF